MAFLSYFQVLANYLKAIFTRRDTLRTSCLATNVYKKQQQQKPHLADRDSALQFSTTTAIGFFLQSLATCCEVTKTQVDLLFFTFISSSLSFCLRLGYFFGCMEVTLNGDDELALDFSGGRSAKAAGESWASLGTLPCDEHGSRP